MKARLPLLLALLVCVPAAVAADEPYKVSATVVRDGRFVMKVDMEIPQSGEFIVTSREESLRLEILTTTSTRDPKQTVVKLVEFSGSQPRVMHTSRSADPVGTARSFTYRICGNTVTFISPAPASPPGCDALVRN